MLSYWIPVRHLSNLIPFACRVLVKVEVWPLNLSVWVKGAEVLLLNIVSLVITCEPVGPSAEGRGIAYVPIILQE